MNDDCLVYGWDYERVPFEINDVVNRDEYYIRLDAAKKFMVPFEIRILDLLFLGHGATTIAKIVKYGSRQHGVKLINTIIKITSFFCKNVEQIECMIGDCSFEYDEYLILKSLFVDRLPYKLIAVEYDKSVNWIQYRIRNIGKKYPQYRELLREFTSLTILRSWWCFYMWREKFCKYICKLQDRGIWYEWGGQNIADGIADCSGLVIEVYKKLGILSDRFADTTAQGLSELYENTSKPEMGDLVFYGRGWDRVTHVMFYYGKMDHISEYLNGEYVVGMAGGGGSKTTKNIASRFGIGLWFRSINYRRDFLGVKKVEKRRKQ